MFAARTLRLGPEDSRPMKQPTEGDRKLGIARLEYVRLRKRPSSHENNYRKKVDFQVNIHLGYKKCRNSEILPRPSLVGS